MTAKSKTEYTFFPVAIPARPFTGLSEKQKTRYREWIRKWKR